jgi:hypothetical protein
MMTSDARHQTSAERKGREGEPPRMHEFITNFTKRGRYFFDLIARNMARCIVPLRFHELGTIPLWEKGGHRGLSI